MSSPEELISWIRQKIRLNEYQVKLHSLIRINERGFLPREVREALLSGKIIEDYPDDMRGHSCLVWGKTSSGKDLHLVCGIADEILWIITIYEPTADKWETPERRKRP